MQMVDHRVGIVIRAAMLLEHRFVFELLEFLGRQLVDVVARPLAFATADTDHGVDQDPITVTELIAAMLLSGERSPRTKEADPAAASLKKFLRFIAI